ncbi:572_t:CDS:2 [Paraglomus occultum]|uniref:572_t:CDS:1 n=1 Tax=Paraglomus occultum TaxID=144539 RepID=A0A9N8WPH5_9GLOM|nr:572_t:CDS:2 [Paraglomus occultum]
MSLRTSELDDLNCETFYTEKRHKTAGNPKSNEPAVQDWKMRDRLKTISGALVLCLNIGVDPPDVVKPSPCAKLECWVDPFTLPPTKALDAIGKNLQSQYEQLSMRTRYKQYLDPAVNEVRDFCLKIRKTAKEERVLFHYNGHGVPKPTTSGEIWVFNKNFTQYIPVSLGDLQSWLGSPCIYVYDCSAAGNILNNFNKFAEQKYRESRGTSGPSTVPPSLMNIQLAACGPNESLPLHPELPADLFTSCLTSPIETALRYFVLQRALPSPVTVEMVMKLPGKLQDRKTPLGELNWIFTAITDTIAWNVLRGDLFKQLFRQDLMVAALFRNFLLAERIMRHYQCNPMSYPELPPTHDHSMWDAWDLAVDVCLRQLPVLLSGECEYQHSTFFDEQLTAFGVWLERGSIYQKPPQQLPIVLQVLLSQVHRSRALGLLSKFLDLGPWAVNLALSIGIFPYVLKLLQSPAADLKPPLVFIWARILAVDGSCQQDLLRDNGYKYFINILSPSSILNIPNEAEHRAMCAFILAMFCTNFSQGQMACKSENVLNTCLARYADEDPLLRQWVCLCIGQYWKGYRDAKSEGIENQAHQKLFELLTDPVPEVRAAALYALGTFIGNLDHTEQILNIHQNIAITTLTANNDGSPMVRKELVITLSRIVSTYIDDFIRVAVDFVESIRKRAKMTGIGGMRASVRDNRSGSVDMIVWQSLLNLSRDPDPEVAQLAASVVDFVHELAFKHNDPGLVLTVKQLLEARSASENESLRDYLNKAIPGLTVTVDLPLNSQFFEYSCEYFREPQMRPAEADLAGSVSYMERTWRHQRNLRIMNESLPMKQMAGSSKWNKQVALFHHESVPMKLLFHNYEPHLIAANDKDSISVWDWQNHIRVNTFSNCNPRHSSISALKFINEHDVSMLLVGSNDGTVRIWRDYTSIQRTTELVTSWRAIPDLLSSNQRIGIVAEWQQRDGCLLVGGDVRVIRVWDAPRELNVVDIPTRTGSAVTSLTSDGGNLFVAGFADGAIRLYDRRVSPNDAMTLVNKEHKNSIVNVVWQKGSAQELVSGSKSGEIKVWDIRTNWSKVSIPDNNLAQMAAMDVHQHTNVIASAYSNQTIKLYNTGGLHLSTTKYNTGFLGWGAQVTCLALAGHQTYFAAGATDSYVSLYGVSGSGRNRLVTN